MSANPAPATAAALSLLMLVSGFGIPVMAALNAALGRHLGSPTAATAALYAVGLALSLAVALIAGLPSAATFRSAPPQLYLGAAFVVFYILAVTFTAPRIGVGNAVFFVLLGQVIAAAAIDHFALLGALRTAFTLRRGLGIALMATGLYFARRTG
ncbi:MAG: DMT family transporter [Sphingomonadales bacterium]|nr:DMT family transporter [Sphingomonadales bacterium]